MRGHPVGLTPKPPTDMLPGGGGAGYSGFQVTGRSNGCNRCKP